jgi:hypothetical protein
MTSTTSQEPTVLRTGDRGRARVPAERREELLREFDRSGISAMKFAPLAGVKYATLANWLQKRRKAQAAQAQAGVDGGQIPAAVRPVRLFEAFAEPERKFALSGACLTVEFPGGARVAVESPAQLPMVAELLALAAQNPRPRC